MKKKLLSALLTVSLLFGAAGTAYASGETGVRFYNIYGSNMIFEQNCTADGRTEGKTVYPPFALFNRLYELFNGVKG